MTSLTEDAHLLPTDDDVDFYRQNGYWVSGQIVPDEVITRAEHGMERVYAGDFDQDLPDGRPPQGWAPEHGDVLRKNDFVSLAVGELAALVRHPLVGACAARLAGVDEIRLWHDQLLYKPAEKLLPEGDRVNVGWHTDRQYWRTCSSAEMLTAWVPFHTVGATEGSVSFVPGSHRWAEDIALNFFDPDLSTLDRLRADHRVEVVVTEIPRGAVSFHHCRTIHGSGPNRSDGPRRSIAIHMQPGDNHFVRSALPEGGQAHHGIDSLVRRTAEGDPDYSDPAACARLWPAQR
jgi:ectoine hydroxylase-related dioxygenase (phytanoyl-CoA dioxygenase family)